MAGNFISEARLKSITKRQKTPAWGSKYQPAMRATRAEAPRISRPTILHPSKLGRDMHLMSEPETAFALLALYHPGVFDIHEQHVISTLPALHPLSSHPEAASLRLPDLPGSIAVAEALNILNRHPKIFLNDLGAAGAWVPFPYLGDLLLFLRDQRGPHCVNWTIKNRIEEFRAKRLLPGMRRHKARTDVDDVRHQLEAGHFAKAKIRTVQLALPMISTDLVRNLRNLHGWDARTYEIDESTRQAVTVGMRETVGTSTIAFHRMQELSQRHGCSVEIVRAITNSAIWRRDLRVDLFRPLVVDRPLRAELIDPVAKYASWFRR